MCKLNNIETFFRNLINIVSWCNLTTTILLFYCVDYLTFFYCVIWLPVLSHFFFIYNLTNFVTFSCEILLTLSRFLGALSSDTTWSSTSRPTASSCWLTAATASKGESYSSPPTRSSTGSRSRRRAITTSPTRTTTSFSLLPEQARQLRRRKTSLAFASPETKTVLSSCWMFRSHKKKHLSLAASPPLKKNMFVVVVVL